MLGFKLCGVRITISFWFFAAIGFFLLYERSALFWYFAAPVVVHELGHMVALYACGGGLLSLELCAFGINMRPNSRYLSYFREFIVILAGIASNALLAIILLALKGQTMRSMLLISVNLAVAAFNLLPIGNLDGGILLKLFCERTSNGFIAYKISRAVSFTLLLPLLIFAFHLTFQNERNFTLLIVCIYLSGILVLEG